MSKIRFRVCLSSGEDADFPASELDVHSPQTKGWQSPRFCDYPQEIGLAMEARAHLSRVQILSHQSKIASKIELYIGDGPSYEQAHFERLGYLSLNSNQRSNYQARELKSVFINCTGRYLRILAHRCYVNKYNLFNQVGLIAVNLLGEVAADEEQHHLHAEVQQQQLQQLQLQPGERPPSSIAGVGIGGGGSALGARPPSTLPPEPQDLAYQLSPFDPETTRQLAALTEAKEAAVRVEDYDTAKRLKAAERELRALGEEISQLEARKQEAVRVEDYDRAKALKAEIAVLRRNMDARLRPVLASAGLESPLYAPPSPPTTTTTTTTSTTFHPPQLQQQPPPPLPQAAPQDQQPRGYSPPTSYAPNPYDEIPVGGGSAAQQARAAAYAASRSVSSSSDAAPHHQVHYASDPVLAASSPGGGPSGYSATAAGGESGVAGGPAQPAVSPRKGNAVFDEDAAIVVANRPAATLLGGDDGGADAASAGSPLSVAADPSWAYQGSGPHPLAGVSNHKELPPPEPLPPGSKVPGLDPADVNAIKHFLGEYVARCLFSRTWALRDAALVKARLLVQDASAASGAHAALDIKEALPALSDALALGLDDKIAQVFMTSLALLDALLAGAQQARMKRSQAGPLLEPVISILVAKLGDGQARIRDAALAGLLAMAKSPCVGPGGLGPYALRRLPPKQLSAGKTVLCRLQLLRTLVEETKLGATSGLSADGVMGFMKELKAFAHSSNEVRDAAREVTVAVYRVIGPRVLRYIEPLLRRKQMDEYEEAFRRAGGGGDGCGEEEGEGAKRRGSGGGGARGVERERPWAGAAPAAAGAAARTSPPSGSKGRPGSGGQGQSRGLAGQPRQPRGSPPRQQHQHQHQQQQQQEDIDFEISDSFDEDLGEGGDAHMCQFCGRYDPGFSEDALDHHYFVECPLLMRCSECGQVIEIFGLAEHLLTECEFKDAYAPCPKSGLAVRRDQLEAWEAGPGAYFEKALHAGSSPGKKQPQHHALCPLCFYDIRPPTEEGIRSHYVGHCVNNPRRPGSGVEEGATAGGSVSA